jgi:hypothetical protein
MAKTHSLNPPGPAQTSAKYNRSDGATKGCPDSVLGDVSAYPSVESMLAIFKAARFIKNADRSVSKGFERTRAPKIALASSFAISS